MLAAGIILAWAGYGVGSYGWCMIRGWDVPLRGWFSPLHPYEWPAGGPAQIPDTQLFPGSTAATAAPGGPAGSGTGPSSSGSSGGGGLGNDIRRAWDWFW